MYTSQQSTDFNQRDGLGNSYNQKKVEAMKRIKPPKTSKQPKQFLGMINFYRDIWKKRSQAVRQRITKATQKRLKDRPIFHKKICGRS